MRERAQAKGPGSVAAPLFIALSLLLLGPAPALAEVTMRTGEYSLRYVDLIQPGGLKYAIARVYRSKARFQGIFGQKWLTELQTGLASGKDGALVVVEAGGGSRLEFRPVAPGSATYKSASPQALGQTLTRSKTGYVRSRKDGSSDYFSPGGKLVRMLDGKNYLDFHYGTSGRLESLTDNLGQKFAFTYDEARGLVTKIQGPSKSSNYTYNPAGELVLSRDESGAVTTYQYTTDGRHLLTEVSLPDRSRMQLRYLDAAQEDRVKTFTDRKGVVYSYTYEQDPADKNHFKASERKAGPQGQHLGDTSYEYFFGLRANGDQWLKRLITMKDGQRSEVAFDEVSGKEIQGRDSTPMTPQEEAALRAYLPAVIRIQTIGRGCVTGGTGFFVSPDGLAVTNRHVLEPALRSPDCRIRLTLPGAAPLKKSWAGLSKAQLRHLLEEGATVTEKLRIVSCGKTKGRDLCLLKLDAYPDKNFRLESSFPPEKTPIFTIGNPMNEGLMIDSGEYLNRMNNLGISQVSISILTRAGNSGGPIFTGAGQLIGLHSVQYTYRGKYAGQGISNTRTEQAGISAFEITSMVNAYASDPKSYSLEEFRTAVVPGIDW